MNDNVIPLHKKAPELNRFLASLPRADEPLGLIVPPELARSIRFTAGMAGKDPQEFLLDWLKSGFPEDAA
jgi:hypothetical protein